MNQYERPAVATENLANRLAGANAAYAAGYAGGGMVFDQGGTLPPGRSMVWNKTGKPEPLIPDPGKDLGSQIDKLITLTACHIDITRKLLSTTASVPAGVGHAVGGAINGSTSAASFRSRYSRGGA